MNFKGLELGSAPQFAIFPLSFEELQHDDSHAVTTSTERHTQRGSRLAFSTAGVDDDQAFLLFGYGSSATDLYFHLFSSMELERAGMKLSCEILDGVKNQRARMFESLV